MNQNDYAYALRSVVELTDKLARHTRGACEFSGFDGEVSFLGQPAPRHQLLAHFGEVKRLEVFGGARMSVDEPNEFLLGRRSREDCRGLTFRQGKRDRIAVEQAPVRRGPRQGQRGRLRRKQAPALSLLRPPTLRPPSSSLGQPRSKSVAAASGP